MAEKFRAKPFEFKASQWFKDGDHDAVQWAFGEDWFFVQTRQGLVRVDPGDWIITLPDGETYPCKPDVFAMKYERDAAPPADAKPLVFGYRNHRGETAERTVVPRAVRWGSDEFHPEPQWLLDAYCLDRKADRSFAMRDMAFAAPGQVVMSEATYRAILAAPPADAGEGDAGLARTIKDIRAALGDRRPDDATMKVCPYGGGSGRETVYPLAGELRALLAAAERGGGPGPATRWLLDQVKAASDKAGEECNYLSMSDAEVGKPLVNLKHKKVVLALRECGIEAPR